ncbi:MAG: aldo/keto reductase [Armatimonadota bacterium]|nr:aldo/keto reductase [Armatimonadota bacterium]MDR7404169.1 aldo/keto reductase [Armatimonadota bacterium]
MEYRFLGRTGLQVSALCFGTQTFGWGADEATAHRMLDRFVDAGGNFLDSADSYNAGESERIVGAWLRARGGRDRLVIATKVFFPTGPDPNDRGLSRKHILASIDGSLRRLQTDYVDLYQMHCWDAATPLEETLDTLTRLVEAGKVRYVGASNFTPSQLDRALMLSRMHYWARVDCLQPEYSLLVRSPEWELLPLCRAEGVGVIPWSPLAGGWLTGKYRRGQPIPPDSRGGRRDRYEDLPEQRATDHAWRVIETLVQVAAEVGKTPSQVALRWLIQQPGVTAPIFGARTPGQLEENLGAVGWALSEEHVARLTEVSAIPWPSPYNFIARYTRPRPDTEPLAPTGGRRA